MNTHTHAHAQTLPQAGSKRLSGRKGHMSYIVKGGGSVGYYIRLEHILSIGMQLRENMATWGTQREDLGSLQGLCGSRISKERSINELPI